MLSLLGFAAVRVWAWRTVTDRRAYIVHSVVTVAVGFVVASWYIVPLVRAYLGGEQQVVADLYLSSTLATTPLTLLYTDPPWVFWLSLVGLVGTVVLLRRAWWAPPFALLLTGIVVLRVLVLLRFIATGHAFLLYYVPYVVRALLLVAGVLMLVEVWQVAVSRAATGRLRTPPYLAGAVATAIVLALTGSSAWSSWAPRPLAIKDAAGGQGDGSPVNLATRAHADRLPSGAAVRYPAPDLASPFPATSVVRAVHATRGRDTDPVVLSYDQRLFAFQPWASYLPPVRSASSALIRWDDRLATVRRLAETTSPEAFASATASTPFGPIDVFVLREQGGRWYFRDVAFAPEQFSPVAFVVTVGLPDDTVVAVRKP
jgi:hypothetical protein